MYSSDESAWPVIGRDDELRLALGALGPDSTFHGVALIGDTGVGKSILAHALADSLSAAGQTVRFVLGTQTGRDVPLGAFSRAVTVDTVHEPAAMLAAAHKTLAAAPNLVVVVDDAQLLDPLSATLVHQLAADGGARLIVTIRPGEPALDAVTALLKEDLLLTLHLDAFTRKQTAELARRVLGDTAKGRLIGQLHSRSGGNPLLLCGLLKAGQDNGDLVHTETGWQLQGALHADRELLDHLAFRLESLARDELDALEILATAELLDWEIFREICDPEAVSRLERRGWIHLVTDGSGMVARLTNPVFGEAALRLAGVVRSRQLNGVLAQACRKHLRAGGGRMRLPDVRGRIRAAQYMMLGDVEPDLDLIVEAAASAAALSNLARAEELARFAVDRGGGPQAVFVLAEALCWQGRGAEAEALLADVDPDESDEMATVRFGCLRAANLFWTCADVESARRTLAGVRDRVGSAASAALVQALDVTFAFFTGDLATTIKTGPALCTPEVMPLVAAWAAVPTALGSAQAGRFDDVRRIAEVGLRAAVLSESGPMRFALGVAEILAFIGAGDLPQADGVVDRYAAMTGGVPGAEAMVDVLAGLVHLARGELLAACSALQDSLPVLSHGAPSPWPLLVAAWLAQAEGVRGNATAAAVALRSCEAAYGPQAAVFQPELELARAWERAAAGEVSAGQTHAVCAAQLAHDAGMCAVEMSALHTAVRFGDRSHADRLAELAGVLNTPLAEVIAAHAHGLADHDGDLLSSAADQFAELGALALAADAAAQAADERMRGGRRGKGLESSARAQWLAGQGDIRTPAITAVTQPLPVTDREREIATLVAAGLSNRQIADRLSVSVRTVDGHLYRIYAKLGIEGRDELVTMFQVAGPPA